MASMLVGRARSTRTIMILLGLLAIGSVLLPDRAWAGVVRSATATYPTPNPSPNHTAAPSDPPRSPQPAPAPPDIGAVATAGEDSPAVATVRVTVASAARVASVPGHRIALSTEPRFAESLFYSGLAALAIASFGLVVLGMRRRLW